MSKKQKTSKTVNLPRGGYRMGGGPSNSKANLFNTVKVKRPDSNTFNLTHQVTMSGKMGLIMPCCVIDCLPGDKFTIGTESLTRFAPLITPVMHRMNQEIMYFFVPNRILWEHWEDFIFGNGEIEHPFPYITFDRDDIGSEGMKLANYLGISIPQATDTGEVKVSAMPFAAKQMIYNEWFRDENLIDPLWDAQTSPLSDGNNNSQKAMLTKLRRVAFAPDYFTKALPFAQKGEAVDIPIGQFGDVPVFGATGEADPLKWQMLYQTKDDDPANPAQNLASTYPGYEPTPVQAWMEGSPFAMTSLLSPEAVTINDLRTAIKLQEWLEINARAGTRYKEGILAHFGVYLSDERIQRPEYIVGVQTPIVVSEVLNSTGEEGGLPQGNMAGHAVSITGGKHGTFFAEEHGYIIGLAMVTPKPAYMSGIPRHFLKFDRYDFAWNTFANLGEQEVKNIEIMGYQGDDVDNGTFGYVPRYAEYKYIPDRVAGDFVTTLSSWHLARRFATQPALNEEFINVDWEEFNTRLFAVSDDTDNLYFSILNTVRASRRLPFYGTPSI